MKNKVAVVTGASSGLGKELALSLADVEFNIVISGRNKERLNVVKKEIEKKGSKCLSITGDITKKDVRQKLFSETIKTFGRADVLVNNAGVYLEKPFDEVTEEELDSLIDANTLSHIKLTRLFYSHMKEKKSGKIVNIISVNALSTKENISAYAVSKGAMKSFTESLRFEANKHSVQVFGVYPGGMQTNIFKNAGLQKDISKFMDPKEVAETVVSVIKNQKASTSDIIFYRMMF